MDLAICSDSCKDCGGEGRPCHVPNHTVEVKGEHCVAVESGRRGRREEEVRREEEGRRIKAM